MERKATKFIKWVYCLCVVFLVGYFGIFGEYWALKIFSYDYLKNGWEIPVQLFAMGLMYQVVRVVRLQGALDAFVSGRFTAGLRMLGIFWMAASVSVFLFCAIGGIVVHNLNIEFEKVQENVILLLMRLVLTGISIIGLLPGIILFEASRMIGSNQRSSISG